MKKTFAAIALAVASALAAGAQENFARQPLTSPQTLPDGSITISTYAPEGTAKVEIFSRFVPNMVAPMTKGDDGVWRYTLPADTPADLYTYWFVADGRKMLDESNAFVVRDISSLMNILIVDGEASADYLTHDVAHGNVTDLWYPSQTHGQRRVRVYTPAGYNASDATTRYPVLYLLHGMGGDETAWSELGRAVQILDNNIARGDVVPMIVVMPNGNISQSAAPGYTVDGHLNQPRTDLPETMNGAFETEFPALVAFVDSTFNTVPRASGRAIAGLSMGGFHTMNISRSIPGTFDYIGLFSSAMLNHARQPLAPVHSNELEGLRAQFAAAPRLYYIAIGVDDFLYNDNSDYRRLLDSEGFPYVYRESADGHIWSNWRHYLCDFLPRLFK